MRISAGILAGGKGERLGQEKATLRLGGRTLLERVADVVDALSDDLVVVQRADQELTFGQLRSFTASTLRRIWPWLRPGCALRPRRRAEKHPRREPG